MNIIGSSVIAMVAWLLMIGQGSYRKLSRLKLLVFAIAVISVAAKGIARIAMMANSNTLHPPEWDFLIFWIDGVMASRGLNFYDSVLAAHLAAPFHPSAGFVQAALVARPRPSCGLYRWVGWTFILRPWRGMLCTLSAFSRRSLFYR